VPGYTLDDGITVKNKLGATSHDELEAAEADYVSNRLLQFELGYGPAGQFDAAHLKAIHRHLFQDVYEWAGHTRDEEVALSDGTVATEPVLRKADGHPFWAGPLIPNALECIAAALRETNYLRGLSRAAFATRAADVMAGINGIHPFREGNGRTQRAFMRGLAKEAGYELDFSVVTRERMVQASIAASEHGDSGMMRRMFDEISDPARVAALKKALDDLSRHDFPWNDRYVATAEPGHRVEAVMAGIAGGQFMARTESTVLIGQVSDLPQPPPMRGETFTFEPAPWESARQPPTRE
jgi:cell filamentation protein